MRINLRHFCVNAICGLIWGRDRRRRVRTVLNANMTRNIRFIRRDLKTRIYKLKINTGVMGRNVLVLVNNKWAYKFPVASENYNAKAVREKRIVDALRKYSPVYVPDVELITMHTRDGDVVVRKYEFVPGCTVREMSPETVLNNLDTLARQIAAAVYKIACADPKSIRDLKPTPNERPGYMRGWCQGDICDNFMIDEKTMRITAYIDWEDSRFINLRPLFQHYKKSPSRELMMATMREYDKLYKKDNDKR